MPKLTLMGHPAHPQFIVAPAALLPFTLVMDVLFRRTRRRSFRDAAVYSLTGAVGGGIAAAATGAMDYLAIPSGTQEKQVANVHAMLNIGLIGAATANLAIRMAGADSRDNLPLFLSALAAAGVIASGWFGGHLVYAHGVRVGEADKNEDAVGLPGDARVKRGLEHVAHSAPAHGPTTADASRSIRSGSSSVSPDAR